METLNTYYINNYLRLLNKGNTNKEYSVTQGEKYYKVTETIAWTDQAKTFCLVDIETGDIVKFSGLRTTIGNTQNRESLVIV